MAWVLFAFAALDFVDDVDEPLIGVRLDADLLALAHDKAVDIRRLAPARRAGMHAD